MHSKVTRQVVTVVIAAKIIMDTCIRKLIKMLPISQICKNGSVCFPQKEEMDVLGLKTLLTLWKRLFSKINFIIVAITVNLLPSQLETFLGRAVEGKNKKKI